MMTVIFNYVVSSRCQSVSFHCVISTRCQSVFAVWCQYAVSQFPLCGVSTMSVSLHCVVSARCQSLLVYKRCSLSLLLVPVGPPSRGGDVTVYVLDLNRSSLPTLLFGPCVCFCLYSPFNCISFHKFSRQLYAFSLCSSGLISVLLVLSTIYLSMTVSLSPDIILCG